MSVGREEVRGMRMVTLQHDDAAVLLRAKELVLQRALGAAEQQQLA